MRSLPLPRCVLLSPRPLRARNREKPRRVRRTRRRRNKMLFFVATIKSFQIGCHMVHILLLLGLFV